MADKIGPLLRDALDRESRTRLFSLNEGDAPPESMAELSEPVLPVIASAHRIRPEPGEPFDLYAERVRRALGDLTGLARDISPLDSQLLITGNAVSLALPVSRIDQLQASSAVVQVELDARIQAASLDDAMPGVGQPHFQMETGLTGAGIRVALLDSGIDEDHPHLHVSGAVSTCGEPVHPPGRHGTHCAGCLASRDADFTGIAPHIELYNVKVLDHQGNGTPTSIGLGIDRAAEWEADIVSMSLGFNQLPKSARGGHGWLCENGTCQLCNTVENAIDLGMIIIIAAGNVHELAEDHRKNNPLWDVTEITCPGHAKHAITIGALTKGIPEPAAFSSHGPTRYGAEKPDLSAPGVNITSCAPVPRDWQGAPLAAPSRDQLFFRESGTSMATPMVAGAAALMLEYLKQHGRTANQAEMKQILTTLFCNPLPHDRLQIGEGQLKLPDKAAIPLAPWLKIRRP